ncbi:MAG: protein-disulfide reductase DsbD, partial [Methylophilaceae bacterium]
MLKRFSKAVVLFSTLLLLTAQLSFSANSFAGLSAFSDDDDDSFLHPDKAFKLGVVAKDNGALEATFTIAPGYYLYKDRIQFSIKDAALGAIKTVALPAGDMKDDPNFGAKEVYHHDFAASITIENAAKDVVIHARYQGCSEKGVCYAQQLKTLNIAMPDAQASNNVTSTAAASNATVIINNEDEATALLKSGTLWLIAVGFFGFGLLLSFTPCVLPMIPILSGIIVGDKKAHKTETSRLHSFNLSLAYVLGIALSYTVAGIAAGLSGHLLSSALQSPWVLTATSLIFVVLSFSMFGFYELRLPSAIEERMVNTANKLKGGQLLGVFAMGVISALIVSPCVAAPLAGALIYISQTRDVVLGGVALFALSIGMGVPLLLIGA